MSEMSDCIDARVGDSGGESSCMNAKDICMSAKSGDGRGTVTQSVDTETARDLLRDLVEISSPTGEERECAERLAAFFENYGREVRLDEVGNVRAPADDSVLLTSHVDTVPGEIPVRVESPNQSNEKNAKGNVNISYSDENNSELGDSGEYEEAKLWGRGSVDAKGSLTAMAVAAVETGVSFVGVVGEETDSRGARYLIEDREAPDALVNGEPSGWDGVTLGYRGFLAGEYAVSTDSTHTSRPDSNAIQQAMAWWSRVEAIFGDASDGSDESGESDERAGKQAVFEQVTAKPVKFSGGTATDGLSVEANTAVQFRIPPDSTAEAIRNVVEGELEAGNIDWQEPIAPVMESPRTKVARAFRVAIRRVGGDPRLLRKTGTSDMNVYAGAWDCPMATYGPGNSDLDHAPNEHLGLGDFDRSIAVLTAISEDLIDS